ncbi:hypothetical protein M0R45_036152 [Rubus argutus]|uniref:Uncharacterized protein n=1 Tax=Rubus argutus TaxID=59490 RepID=A0AAW1VYV2_RUBAR
MQMKTSLNKCRNVSFWSEHLVLLLKMAIISVWNSFHQQDKLVLRTCIASNGSVVLYRDEIMSQGPMVCVLICRRHRGGLEGGGDWTELGWARRGVAETGSEVHGKVARRSMDWVDAGMGSAVSKDRRLDGGTLRRSTVVLWDAHG